MDVSGGNVTITKSEAWENGGSGRVGRFLGPRTGGRGMPPQEVYVARRASWAMQFWGEGSSGARPWEVQADATPAVTQQVIFVKTKVCLALADLATEML